MLIALILLINIIASFTSNMIKARFDKPSLAEHYMLQMLVRFSLTVLTLGYFMPRVPMMGLAVVAPFLTLATSYVVKKAIGRFHLLTMIEHKLISDIIQVVMVSVVCLNLQYLV